MEKPSSPQKSTRSADEAALSANSEPHAEMELRRSKRAGRPPLYASSNAILSDDRRAQIRRAQRTYRSKKEAVFRNSTARAKQLEERLRTAVEEVVRLSEVAAEAQLHLSHHDIHARLKRLHRILTNGQNPIETGSPDELSPDSCGRQVPVLDVQVQSPQEYQYQLPRPLPTRQSTYAFQEVSFTRRLQRYCLFTGSRSNAREFYHMFWLFPCVREPGKTQPLFGSS